MKITFTIFLLLPFCFLPFTHAQQWVKVEAGTEFSLALRSDGTLWAWGFNANGQLGAGNETEPLPIQVGTDTTWKDIAVGAVNSFAIKENGTLWAWGFNFYGQLGLGSTAQAVRQPELVGLDTNWAKVEAGVIHTLALKNDSSLWSFGGNLAGGLGHSQGSDVYIPTQVDSHQYIDIATGGFHSLAIRKDQTLWGWGDNGGMQVSGDVSEQIVWSPHLLDSNEQWINVEGGFQYSAAQRSDSILFTWGFNGNAQLGHSVGVTSVGTPTAVDLTKKWKLISPGASFMHAILKDGTLWGWGFNGLGQLGTGNSMQRSTPTQIGSDTTWRYISDARGIFANQSVFGLHSLALKGEATSICVSGANYQSQLGTGDTDNRTSFDCTVAELATSAETPAQQTARVNLYPNPVHDILLVNYYNAEADWTFELYDAQSKLQVSREVRMYGTTAIDVAALPSGMYIGMIKSEGRVVASKKVIITH